MQINKDNVTFGNGVTVPTSTVERVIANPNDFIKNGATSITLGNMRINDDKITSKSSLRYVSNFYLEVNTVAVYGASGSFTVPAGVYVVSILAAGGGAGGQGYHQGGGTIYNPGHDGYNGGAGGAGIIKLKVTPGSTITFTVGAGGNGGASYDGYGGPGGTTTVTYGGKNVLVATGGAADAAGTRGTATSSYAFSDTNLYNLTDAESVAAMELEFVDGSIDTAYINGQSILQTVAGTAARAYSYAGAYKMGAPGAGGTAISGSGGVGGGVMIFYKV